MAVVVQQQQQHQSSGSSGGRSPNGNTSNNGGSSQNQGVDTTYTKIFVGGLAWETMKKHFEQYGDIQEAVFIMDKNTGRSKGYGFVTFKEAEAAKKACADPTPVIDGRRANCNLASLGAHRGSQPSPPSHSSGQVVISKEHLKVVGCLPIMGAWHIHHLVPMLTSLAIHILLLCFQHILQTSVLLRWRRPI